MEKITYRCGCSATGEAPLPKYCAEHGTSFAQELESLINRYSKENGSDTPDFILAQYLLGCLQAWNVGVQQREHWYGRPLRTNGTGGTGPSPVDPGWTEGAFVKGDLT